MHEIAASTQLRMEPVCLEHSCAARARAPPATSPQTRPTDGLGATFDLYSVVYGRNSIDDNGMDLVGSVHYGNNYDNAFWNGTQMVFGDGDGTLFNRFTIAIDVMGHELTHGVTGTTAKLEYHDQPGALDELISDVSARW